MTTTKTRIAALLIGASATLISVQSFAHGGPMGGDCARASQGDRMQQHQKRLHDALKLTPQQEAAWTKYQESHPVAQRGQRPDPAEFDKLTSPERADRMLELQKQRQDAMGKHVVALKDFYAQLNPEQKKTFDEQMQRGGRHGQRGGQRPGQPENRPAPQK